MSTISINTEAGTATIESRVFTGYSQEAHQALQNMADATAKYKEVVDTVAENTKLKKGVVSKYFKLKYREKTSTAVEEGEIFKVLSEITNV